ncbi:MAG: GNAT family N-acetyltransferase [Bacillus sp. (in: Bacteria)]|nr:GNAT family N-acetyltransferase [Bacillus sp. (in: firmicutes)]
MVIRTIVQKDAELFLKLSKKLDSETNFLLFEADERTTTVEEQAASIQKTLAQSNSTILVVEDNDELVGYIWARGGHAKRTRHMVHIVIGILQSHTGKGLGTKLFQELEKWAKVQNIHRLELTLMATNKVAFKLYEKMGFGLEGTKRDVYVIDNEFVDEYMMAKFI